MSEEIAAADANLIELARLRTAVRDLREINARLQAQLNDAQKATAEFDRMRLLACQEMERLTPIARESGQRHADLIFLRAECDGLNERLAQAERATEAERSARRAFEADAAAYRRVIDVLSRAGDISSVRGVASAALGKIAAGQQLLNELTLLRELADDLTRWREAGGDIRDLAYVFETMDRLAAMKEGGE